ncbi:hypothetical protein ACJX0J_037442, partial [Zea mays]
MIDRFSVFGSERKMHVPFIFSSAKKKQISVYDWNESMRLAQASKKRTYRLLQVDVGNNFIVQPITVERLHATQHRIHEVSVDSSVLYFVSLTETRQDEGFFYKINVTIINTSKTYHMWLPMFWIMILSNDMNVYRRRYEILKITCVDIKTCLLGKTSEIVCMHYSKDLNPERA